MAEGIHLSLRDQRVMREALRSSVVILEDPELTRLRTENAKLRAMIRVNALRWCPGLSHAEIDEMIQDAIDGPALDPAP